MIIYINFDELYIYHELVKDIKEGLMIFENNVINTQIVIKGNRKVLHQ